MAGLNGGLSPSVVKTALDQVFFAEYELPAGPDVATAEDSAIFNQSMQDKGAVVTEVFQGPGEWGTRAELADVKSDTVRVGDQQTFTILNYANSVDISKNLFDDDQHDVVQRMMREFAMTARVTRDKAAFGLLRGGFATTLVNDGDYLFSDSHTTLSGATVDNLLTGALTGTTLQNAIQALLEQKNQAGIIVGHQAATLVVPPALYNTAVEITQSVLRAGTANNDMNVYSAKYGLAVKQSPYLGAAAGGSDTAWFVLARNHALYRYIRQAVVTDLVPYQYQRNNSYIYKGEFREKYGAISYEGAVGSAGA